MPNICKDCKNSEDFNLKAIQTSIKTVEEIGTVQLDENGNPDWETFEPTDHTYLDDGANISNETEGVPTCEYCEEDAEDVSQSEYDKLVKEWDE